MMYQGRAHNYLGKICMLPRWRRLILRNWDPPNDVWNYLIGRQMEYDLGWLLLGVLGPGEGEVLMQRITTLYTVFTIVYIYLHTQRNRFEGHLASFLPFSFRSLEGIFLPRWFTHNDICSMPASFERSWCLRHFLRSENMTRIHQIQEFQKMLQKGYAWQMGGKINNKENNTKKKKKKKHP